MITRIWVLLAVLMFSVTTLAAENWLIATPTELLGVDGEISVEVVKPSNVADWPNTLTLILTSQNARESIELVTVETSDVRRSYTGVVQSGFTGTLRAELANESSNRLLMTANSVEAIVAAAKASKDNEVATVKDSVKTPPKKHKRIVVADPVEDRTISANEPLYFIVGSNSERSFDARFQLSFKYRPFDPDARVATFIPFASNLYFAYTQTSIWDLGGESSPFKDTSYRPSVYYHWTGNGKGFNPDSWKFGLEHESNGQDEEDSRSMNMAFVQPFWKIDYSGGKQFTFMPKFYTYLEKSDNPDMHHYRGYVDWLVRYGRSDAAILTAMYRQGTGGYAQGQLDLSYPVSDKLFGRTGTFLHLQLLGGYGETLIDYNRRSDTQLRIGISLAR